MVMVGSQTSDVNPIHVIINSYSSRTHRIWADIII